MKKGAIFIAISLLLFSQTAYALEKFTHMAINRDIAARTISQFSLDSYLINSLGFPKGLKEEFLGIQVLDWLAEGGKAEDEPDDWRVLFNRGRSNNHYHNPLKAWNVAGLNDSAFGKQYTGQSSILWAQNTNQNVGEKGAWQDARRYYYEGLTSATKTAREAALAKTFQALGQLTHLVHDASVPAHARNQIHVRYNYENWLEDIRTYENERFMEFIRNPISFDKGILSISPNDLAPLPIARIIDTDQYNGDNPGITTSNSIGIAEYANANFFSEGTVFSEKFPYPAKTSVEEADYSIPDPRDNGKTVLRRYYKKIGDGEVGYRMATVGSLRGYIVKYFRDYTGLEKKALDGGVLEDYARRLLPRAVGYSAGLLEYFFRGKMEVHLGAKDLSIENLSSEGMDGEFTLFYDASDGTRKPVPGASWSLAIAPADRSDDLEWNIPSDLAETSQYIMVFQGKLGNEPKAVAAKVWSMKYHWAIVVDYPPKYEDRFEIRWKEAEGSYTDCGYCVGTEGTVTITEKCPSAGDIQIYLVASDHRLHNNNIYNGCQGNLTAQNIGEWAKGDLWENIHFQIIQEDGYFRLLSDPYGTFSCQLRNGKMSYPTDSYSVWAAGPWELFTWGRVPIDSPETAKMGKNLFPENRLFFAYRGSNLSQGEFGFTYPVGQYSYAGAFPLGIYYNIYSQDENHSCYDMSKGNTPNICFEVLTTVPEDSPQYRYRSIRIRLPNEDNYFPFWEYWFPCPICFE